MVGNGKKIIILNQPWLQDETNPYITSVLQGLDNVTVDSLRTEDGQQWDKEILEDLFNQRDQHCIYNTHFGGESEGDMLYWNEDMTGEYTVRSAYRLIRLQKEMGFSSDSRDLWKLIWRIKAPPKVLNHIWRASVQCLPTRINLQVKMVLVSVICPMCNDGEETVIHILVSCPFATQCWRQRSTVYQDAGNYSFDSWLKCILDKSTKEEYGEIVTLCWSIWQARNQMVWDNKKSEVNHVVFSAKQYLAEWKEAQGNSTKALYKDVIPGDGASSWVRPQKNTVKISVDTALFAEYSKYGIGLLARDDEGQVIQGRSEVYKGTVMSELAEAIAVKEALSWAKASGWKEVVVESDCLGVIQAICSKVNMLSPFGSIVSECRRLLVELNIELFFVKRSANMAAHCLARESCFFPDRVFYRRSVPIEVESKLLADLFE